MSFTANINEIVAENRNKLLGNHPSWKRVRLKEVATILNGYPFESARFTKDKGTPLIRIRDILDGSTETFYDGAFDSTFLVNAGDLLVGMDGDFHCAAWAGGPSLLNQRVCKIKPDETRYSKQFLRYVLPGYLSAINAETPSVTVKHLSSRTVADIPLPFPPLNEQQRIVAEIEKQFTRLETGVAALRQVQANLKRYRAAVLKAACEGKLVPTEAELRKSKGSSQKDFESGAELLTRILSERRKNWTGRGKYKEPAAPATANLPPLPEGWTWASVEQLGDVQLGRQRSPKNVSKNYPTKYIRAANITERGIDVSDVLEMEFSPAERERFALRDGDILLSEASGSPSQVGKPVVWRDELPLCCFQNTVLRLRPSVVGSKFVLTVFQHCYMNGVFARVAGGVGINHLGAEKFSAIPFPLPPPAEQTRIVAEVERRLSVVEELEAVVSANLQRATRLRQSILQKAFSGELQP